MSDYKHSFVLPEDLISTFIQHVQQFSVKPQELSAYQLLNVLLDNALLVVTSSGIVIYESSIQINEMLRQFKTIHKLNFEIPQSPTPEGKTSTGWEETPKGVWLHPLQLNSLLEILDRETIIAPAQTEKHEQARYVQDHQILVVNNNNVVYTIGGFTGFETFMKRAIASFRQFEDDLQLVILDIQGKWHRIGPVVLSWVRLDGVHLGDLQLAGIKHPSLSRDLDVNFFREIILEHASVSSLVISPAEINRNAKDRISYLKYLDRRSKKWLDTLSLVADEIVVSSALAPLVKSASRIFDSDQHSVALATASIIAEAAISDWKVSKGKQHRLPLDRGNLQELKDHPKANTFMKLCLL